MGKEFISLSYILDENTPLYGGKKGVAIFSENSIELGHTSNSKKLIFSNHSGTHIDFPNHFIHDGLTSEHYSVPFWIFEKPYLFAKEASPNQILNFTNEEIRSIPSDTDILLYKSEFGKYRMEEKYWKFNPGFDPNVAEVLRKNFPKLRVIGMDFISLTAYQHREVGRVAHKAFLGGENPILIIEDMNLTDLTVQPSSIFCFPLLLKGSDASPVNVIASI